MKHKLILFGLLTALSLLLAGQPLQSLSSGIVSAQATTPETTHDIYFWSEDFEAPQLAAAYYTSGTAGSGLLEFGRFQLTKQHPDQRGRIFYTKPAWMDHFTATFLLYPGHTTINNKIADGAAFLFCPIYDYPPATGGTLDASCPGGYIVAFDTAEADDYQGMVYVAYGNTNTRICQTSLFDTYQLADGGWHNTTITLNQGSLSISIDAPLLGNPITLNCTLPGYQPFIGYFGFSAATGSLIAEHRVDSIRINANPIGAFWLEDFSAAILQPGAYYTSGTSGSGMLASGAFLLTQDAASQRGRIFFTAPFWMDRFTAKFALAPGHTSGFKLGDGAAFLFCPIYDYPPAVGGTLDASCPGGYIVAFDTTEGDDYHGRVYVAYQATNNRICQTGQFLSEQLADGNFHNASITLSQGSLAISIDAPLLGNPITLNCLLPGYQPFTGYFGFSAATGSLSAWHKVDDINIIHMPVVYLPLVVR